MRQMVLVMTWSEFSEACHSASPGRNLTALRLHSNKIDFADFQPAEELNEYKFLFDIDGNSWSGRFRR
jgi:hypothetical protein